MKRKIDGMVVAITGASAGIGKALAEALSSRGARLVLAARRMDRLQALNESLGGHHLCLCADVSKREDCRRIVSATVERFGCIDTLVCNAGFAKAVPLLEMKADDSRRLFDANFFGTVDCIQAAAPVMKASEPRDGYRGQIIIVSSAAARRGVPYLGIYASTKAAQLSLAEAARIELQPHGISVTSVHPVITETDFFTSADQLSGLKTAALKKGYHQSAAAVAEHIVKSIQRPRRELWPAPLSRLSLTIAVAFPGLVDFFMRRIRNQFDRENGLNATMPVGGVQQTAPMGK